VDLGRRGYEDALLLLSRQPQHDLGSADVCFDRADRALDYEPHSNRRRQVIDNIAEVDQLGDQPIISYGINIVVEVWIWLEMADFSNGASRAVVKKIAFLPPLEMSFSEVGSNESGTASDQDLHLFLLIQAPTEAAVRSAEATPTSKS